jgi:hypothetical protein
MLTVDRGMEQTTKRGLSEMKLSVTGLQEGLKKRQFDGTDSRLLEIWRESETV